MEKDRNPFRKRAHFEKGKKSDVQRDVEHQKREKEMNEYDALKTYCIVEGFPQPEVHVEMSKRGGRTSFYATVRVIISPEGAINMKSIEEAAIGATKEEAINSASRKVLNYIISRNKE